MREAPELRCRITNGSRPSAVLTSGLPGGPTHLEATITNVALHQKSTTAPQQRGSDSPLAWLGMESGSDVRSGGGPVASAATDGLDSNGYWCHPALADSCMHTGILTAEADGKTRVPGAAQPLVILPPDWSLQYAWISFQYMMKCLSVIQCMLDV